MTDVLIKRGNFTQTDTHIHTQRIPYKETGRRWPSISEKLLCLPEASRGAYIIFFDTELNVHAKM